MIKIILCNNAGISVDTLVMKVGHIDCAKDEYNILKSSVAGPLNDSMKEFIDSGALQVMRDENGSVIFRIKQDNQDDQPALTVLSSLPIPQVTLHISKQYWEK